MRVFSLALLALLGLAQAAQAQDDVIVPKQKKNLTILPVPVLFSQKETGVGYGLGVLLSGRLGQDSATRPSNMRAQYWTTQKKQSLYQFAHTIYSPGEKYFLSGEISYYDNLFFYYGIGNDTKQTNESVLANKLLIVNQRVQKAVIPFLFAGLQYRYTKTTDNKPDNNKTNGDGANYFFDSDNGRLDERQRQNTTIVGLGPELTYDTRDVALAAHTGSLLDATVMFNRPGIGSDYNFTRFQLDARHFQPIRSNNTILALQFVGQFHAGDVPFRELAGIGATLGGSLYNGANLMRGVYEQRFRDRQMMTFQAELRQHVFWRIDAAAFGSAGQVGYNLSDFSFAATKTAGGLGARFTLLQRDRVNVRFDYAFGSSPGFYFAIGEAF